MGTFTVDFEKMPDEPSAHEGYAELLSVYKAIKDEDKIAFLTNDQITQYEGSLSPHLTTRERAFFIEAYTAEQSSSELLKSAKFVSRLYKILMDRHGFKVSKGGGGLGLSDE